LARSAVHPGARLACHARPSAHLHPHTQVACSIAVLVIATQHVADTRFGTQHCYLSGDSSNTAPCSLAYAAAAISLSFAALASCLRVRRVARGAGPACQARCVALHHPDLCALCRHPPLRAQCCSLNCCGLGPIQSILLSSLNCVWWLAVAAVLTASAAAADAARVSHARGRHMLLAAAWTAAAGELLHACMACLVVGNNVCNILFCVPPAADGSGDCCQDGGCCGCCRRRHRRRGGGRRAAEWWFWGPPEQQPLLLPAQQAAAAASAGAAVAWMAARQAGVQQQQQQQHHHVFVPGQPVVAGGGYMVRVGPW
jgi:hypothetical protein